MTAVSSKNIEKLINFTQEEKDLIAHTLLVPKGASDAEIFAFFNVCEKYGFDPLQGDIVFNRYESKYGGHTVAYTIKKDAWLKHAKRQNDFKNLISNPVYEGDEFKVDPINKTIAHSYTTKRGNLIGAYAILYTEENMYFEFTDYKEYLNAFGDKNSLWRTLPSRMIEKAAISNVIKNVYPLGVNFTGEEGIVEDNVPLITPSEPVEDIPVAQAEHTTNEEKSEEVAETTEGEQLQVLNENKTNVPQEVEEAAQAVSQGQAQDDEQSLQQAPASTVELPQEPSTEPIQNETNVSEPTTEPSSNKQPQQEKIPSDAFKFVKKVIRRSNGSSTPTTCVTAINSNDDRIQLYAIDENLNLFDGFVEGDVFTCEVEVRYGSMNFVKTLQLLTPIK